jgi:hypothetical protein
LWRASQRWQGVRMTEVEVQHLRRLRRELGLLPEQDYRNPEKEEHLLVIT